jgi:hypothetical protein
VSLVDLGRLAPSRPLTRRHGSGSHAKCRESGDDSRADGAGLVGGRRGRDGVRRPARQPSRGGRAARRTLRRRAVWLATSRAGRRDRGDRRDKRAIGRGPSLAPLRVGLARG